MSSALVVRDFDYDVPGWLGRHVQRARRSVACEWDLVREDRSGAPVIASVYRCRRWTCEAIKVELRVEPPPPRRRRGR